MSKHSTDLMGKYEEAFQKYLDAYMVRRDLSLLEEMVTDDFCGYGTGFDESFYNVSRGLAIFKRDIASAPNPLHYTLHRHEIKLIDQYNAISVSELDIKTDINDQEVKLNKLRMMMLLHEEEGIVKLCGLHISFPSEVHDRDESYPLKELEERAHLLKRKVEEKTKILQQTIAEQKRTEKALRESEARYSTFINSISGLVFLKDEQFRYIVANKALTDFLGKPLEAVIGLSDFELMPTTEAAVNCRASDENAIKAGSVIIMEEVIGEQVFETTKFPVSLQNNKTGVGGFIRDITERASMEQKRQQIIKAESLNRMAGSIAHHFNNMLSIVIGNLELALTDSPLGAVGAEKPPDYLNEAMEGARRAAEMSAFILAYTGRLQQKMEVHDLSEVCQGIVAGLKETMPSGIRLVTDSPVSFELPARVAPDLVRQALAHLVANAREAMVDEEGEIRVSVITVKGMDISTTAVWPPDWKPGAEEYAAIQVTDTGCGIRAEDLGKVMDPFFSTKFTGRGIGLSVVLGIAQAHQGAVTVESEPGVGSTFQVLFPLADQETKSGRDKVIEPAASLETGGRILLVEDEEMVRNMIAAILRRLGFDVLIARDGMEALDTFRSRLDEIRLVITDLTMPRMNGWETLAALRAIRPDIPVILASGYDEAHVMASDHAEKPQAFLYKPFEIETLRKTLERVLGARQDAQAQIDGIV